MARLTQIDPHHFPDLAVLTGEQAEEVALDPSDQMLSAVRLWKAVLKQKWEQEG